MHIYLKYDIEYDNKMLIDDMKEINNMLKEYNDRFNF
jgi:hypothetical protein